MLRSLGLLGSCLLAIAAGCGAGDSGDPPAPGDSDSALQPPGAPTLQERTPDSPSVAPSSEAPPDQSAPVFQPAFSHALRGAYSASTRTTFRMKVPVWSHGTTLRVVFKAGDGVLTVHQANLARAGSRGALGSPPVSLTFGGSAAGAAGNRQRLTSDPVWLPVTFGEDLYVSFEATGSVSASLIPTFPESYARVGSFSQRMDGLGGGVEQRALVGVAELDVLGPPRTAFLALGDSITEGYTTGQGDDDRASWVSVMAQGLRVPAANLGVSGEGLDQALQFFSEDLEGVARVTDCVVLLGTNDLHDKPVAELEERFRTLASRLAPRCRVWGATLVPKERTSVGSYQEVRQRRLGFNQWLRTQAQSEGVVNGVIDFEAALRSTESPDLFGPGLTSDGIHPSQEGLRVMGQTAAAFFQARLKPTDLE